jgi:hypothetical protein
MKFKSFKPHFNNKEKSVFMKINQQNMVLNKHTNNEDKEKYLKNQESTEFRQLLHIFPMLL